MLTKSNFGRARNLSRSFLFLTISAAAFGAPLTSCNYPGRAAFRAWYTLPAQESADGDPAAPPADAPAPALGDPLLDELLGRALKSTLPEVRRDAVDALGDLGGRAAAALPYILRSLGDPEPRVREEVIDSLSDISARAGQEAAASVAQALARHLSVETDPRLRRDTIQALAKTASAADPSTAVVAADALTATLSDPDSRLAERAASALGDVLGRARSNLEARRAFLEARGRMGGAEPEGADGLAEIERHIAALDEAAGRAVDALGARLRLAHGDTREEIIEAVGRLGPAGGRTLAILAEALRDPEGDVRDEAMDALERFAKERALSEGEIAPVLEALAASLSHPDDDVREDAVELLGFIGRSVPDLEGVGPAGATVVPLLVRALADPDAEVREDAAEALGLMGKKAREAVTALERSALDPKKGVRRAAREALWRIERDTAAPTALERPGP